MTTDTYRAMRNSTSAHPHWQASTT